jgi:MSHA pilin protein MshD
MSTSMIRRYRRRQAGLTFVELVMFIVIVGIGVAGILSVINLTTVRSTDPMLRKQALSIAESLLEEIEAQPFTFCDPDDINVRTATSATVATTGTISCRTTAQVLGATPSPPTETRFTAPFLDNVGDYNGFTMTGIRDITNIAIAGLEAYTATVTIVEAGGEFPAPAIAPANVLRIDVRVTGPAGTNVMLTGYRFRYAPNDT